MKKEEIGPQELAKWCGVFPTTITRWVEQGKIQGFKTPGGRYRFPPESVLKFFREYQYKIPPELEALLLPNILVVDDDKEVLGMVMTTLKRKFGPRVQIHGFLSGYDALVEVGRTTFDVAIVDVFMPKVDGFELCETIRKTEGGEQVKLIMISGNTQAEALKCSERAKILSASYMKKPMNMTLLTEWVGEAVNANAMRG